MKVNSNQGLIITLSTIMSDTFVFGLYVRPKLSLICGFKIALSTVIFDVGMQESHMISKICVKFTAVIAGILYTFMLGLNMYFQLAFLLKLAIALITGIQNTLMLDLVVDK